MPNTNQPFGLRYIGQMGSPPTNSPMMELRNGILSTNTTPIYTGDLIFMSANGYLYQWTATTAGYLCWGVFAGCRYPSVSQQTTVPQKFWPGTDAASGAVLAQFVPGVLSSPALFRIQTDATGITVADRGANADIVVGTGANGFSGAYLNTATINSTATLPLRIIDTWANYSMGNSPEGAGGSSSLAPGTQAGAYNWAVVALNTMGQLGVA